jgi:hypothetical protein
MTMPRSENPHRLEDQLDAALDGLDAGSAAARLPLLRAADELRAACSGAAPDPALARQHLTRVLGPDAAALVTGVGPDVASAHRGRRDRRGHRAAGRRWTRRVAAFALAAALALTPLAVLSRGTLPGEPLYPVKLTVESARMTTVAWSPGRAADERARTAGTRLQELDELVSSGDVPRILGAISALDRALAAAQDAAAAVTGRAGPARLAALDERMRALRAGRTAQLTSLARRLPLTTPVAARVQIEGAVRRSLAGAGR